MQQQTLSGSQADLARPALLPPPSQHGSLSTLKGLFIKSLTLQSRNYCSNLCQIVTPILCLLFTLAVRQIVNGITTGAVKSFDYPQPFNLPVLTALTKEALGLTCEEVYYYEHSPDSEQWARRMVALQAKESCSNMSGLNPRFVAMGSVNEGVMKVLAVANKLNFERGDDLRCEIPDGTVKVKELSPQRMKVDLAINDFRLPEYHKNNGVTKIMVKTSATTTISTYLRVTEGLMSLVDKVTRPFLQFSHEEEIITGSFMYMPFSGEDKSFMNKMINVIGSGLYPLGLSLLLPLFLYMVVSEKEERQIEIMKMNGLNIKLYWVNFFLVSFLLTALTSLLMYLVAVLWLDIAFFTATAPSVIWAVFLGWAVAQVSLTNFMQIFINNSKTATIVGYFLSIFSTLIGVTLCSAVFPAPKNMPYLLLLYPPFALSRVVYLIGMACAESMECYKSFAQLEPQAIYCLTVLYCWFFVYLLSIWLNEMVQQDYGVAHRPAFIEWCLSLCRSAPKEELLEERSPENDAYIEMHEISAGDLVDQSVRVHQHQVFNSPIDSSPLLIRELSKKYLTSNGEKEKVALKPLSLKLIKGEIFGFLGPNGAGKTTLISVLTGMYPQTQGRAYISGRGIGVAETNKLIGVCPQFDILWPELTIQEHMYFYSRLKNVPVEEMPQRVRESLEDVDLYNNRTAKSKELSGGMQRRLSIAIALVGKPSIVILDEPSSGLDPFHRRQIWDILQKCKKKTSIFMTSHMMDEVEFLCDRIGIISLGQLRCIGKLESLKAQFGKGYKLVLNYPNVLRSGGERPGVVRQLIEEYKLNVISELQTRIILGISKENILKCASLLKDERELVWSINKPSLYDVFSHFVQ